MPYFNTFSELFTKPGFGVSVTRQCLLFPHLMILDGYEWQTVGHQNGCFNQKFKKPARNSSIVHAKTNAPDASVCVPACVARLCVNVNVSNAKF